MANIQIEDIQEDPLIDLQLNELELIYGGGWFKRIFGAAMVVAGIFVTPVGIGAAMIGGGAAVLASDDGSNSFW